MTHAFLSFVWRLRILCMLAVCASGCQQDTPHHDAPPGSRSDEQNPITSTTATPPIEDQSSTALPPGDDADQHSPRAEAVSPSPAPDAPAAPDQQADTYPPVRDFFRDSEELKRRNRLCDKQKSEAINAGLRETRLIHDPMIGIKLTGLFVRADGDPPLREVICLPEITYITPDEMALLAGTTSRIILPRLEVIDLATARALESWYAGILYLGGLKSLDPAVAQVLVQVRGVRGFEALSIAGFETLEPEVARALARWPGGHLGLNDITHMSPEAARALGHWPGVKLYLMSLEPDAETLQALATWRADPRNRGRSCISMTKGLESLTPQGAAALATWQGDELRLSGIETMDAETAAALARWPGRLLHLSGLKTYDLETLKALATWPGEDMSLGIPEISPEQAQILTTFKVQTLGLRVDEVSDEVKEILRPMGDQLRCWICKN